ncbi:MAG: class I SAM-dependent methyltransferase [Planctomycetota bacterium]|nr:MAG: class I SAM-dependent methyltransferase [Planctomycetota bacterium]
MKDCESWQPSKFVRRGKRLIASRNPREVSPTSRLFGDLIAAWYETFIPGHASGHLLDLGCGKVPFYGTYREFVDEVTCVDWANSSHPCKHLDLSVDLTGTLPFSDGSFDTVLLSDVLEHIPTPEYTCREIARVLKPGGTLMMNVPFFYWLHEEPYDFHRYTEHALSRLMTISGMEVVRIDRLGGAPEILADVFAKNISLLPVAGKPLAIFAQSVAAIFGRTRFGRKVSTVTSKNFPAAYGMIAVKIR